MANKSGNFFWDKNDLKDPSVGPGKLTVLGLQHTFTMFGATILVPIILSSVGMNISVALLMAGVCTLLFHLLTKGGVPLFLGSSFAFIAPIILAASLHGFENALGGIVIAGCLYVVMAIIVYFVGPHRILSWFPPIVTGTIIMVIGLVLAPVAIDMASTGGTGEITATNWLLALMSFLIVVIVSVFMKGFLKVLPVLISIIVSYIIAVILTVTGLIPNLVDFAPVADAAWFGLPEFTFAKFDIGAIMIIAPVAICTMVEHIGDIMAINSICNKDFIKKPGLHRTLLGDGLASCLSAMFGGPANTTYSENTGVLALTRQFDPNIMRIAAVFAIALGFIPKLAAVISTIPTPIIGGISIVLFGMIASVGARLLVDNKVNFHKSRNLIIAAAILVIGIGDALIPIVIGDVEFSLFGMALAAIVGIILNKLLPGADDYRKNIDDAQKAAENADIPEEV
ncbi:MAG: uracil-xanthine permease family protein [Oscillospiraceae bacterium]|jgi:uracil permease|nr:uracil-xanthine permease family protein [Oscillospiraceae bacterium]